MRTERCRDCVSVGSGPRGGPQALLGEHNRSGRAETGWVAGSMARVGVDHQSSAVTVELHHWAAVSVELRRWALAYTCSHDLQEATLRHTAYQRCVQSARLPSALWLSGRNKQGRRQSVGGSLWLGTWQQGAATDIFPQSLRNVFHANRTSLPPMRQAEGHTNPIQKGRSTAKLGQAEN